MAGKTEGLDELRERAGEAGLRRLKPAHLEELARASAAMRTAIEGMPRDHAPADEPAHVFRAGGGGPAP